MKNEEIIKQTFQEFLNFEKFTIEEQDAIRKIVEKALAEKDKEIEFLENENTIKEVLIRQQEKQKSEFAEFLKGCLEQTSTYVIHEDIKDKIAELENHSPRKTKSEDARVKSQSGSEVEGVQGQESRQSGSDAVVSSLNGSEGSNPSPDTQSPQTNRVLMNSIADKIMKSKNQNPLPNENSVLYECSKCKIPMKHLKEIHTFACEKCGYREWYPYRVEDELFWKRQLAEKDREIEELKKYILYENELQEQKSEFAEFLKSLFKADANGKELQFFKNSILETKIAIVSKIAELEKEREK